MSTVRHLPPGSLRIVEKRVRLWAVISAAAFILAGLAIWYFIPEILVDKDLGSKVPKAVRAEALTAARQSVLLVLGGGIAVVGVVATIFRLTYEHARSSLDNDENLTDRFSTAITQLGHESPAVQNGGIYALQRLAHDSPKEAPVIAQVIAAFVRTCASAGGDRSEPERSAIIMVATMGFDDLDLTGVRMFDLQIPNARLRRARLTDAQMHGCDLSGANLELARLDGADLTDAKLDGANLDGATLRNVQASGLSAKRTRFFRVTVVGSDFERSNLEDAEFDQSTVSDTSFAYAQLTRTSFRGGRLSADLSKAFFSERLDLTDSDLAGSATVLPPRRQIEDREIVLNGAWWHEEPGPIVDSDGWTRFYDREYVTDPRIVYLRPTESGADGKFVYVDRIEERPPRSS